MGSASFSYISCSSVFSPFLLAQFSVISIPPPLSPAASQPPPTCAGCNLGLLCHIHSSLPAEHGSSRATSASALWPPWPVPVSPWCLSLTQKTSSFVCSAFGGPAATDAAACRGPQLGFYWLWPTQWIQHFLFNWMSSYFIGLFCIYFFSVFGIFSFSYEFVSNLKDSMFCHFHGNWYVKIIRKNGAFRQPINILCLTILWYMKGKWR